MKVIWIISLLNGGNYLMYSIRMLWCTVALIMILYLGLCSIKDWFYCYVAHLMIKRIVGMLLSVENEKNSCIIVLRAWYIDTLE